MGSLVYTTPIPFRSINGKQEKNLMEWKSGGEKRKEYEEGERANE